MFKNITKTAKSIIVSIYPYLSLRNYHRFQIKSTDLILNSKSTSKTRKPEYLKIETCLWLCPQISNFHVGGASTILLIADYLSALNKCRNIFVFEQPISNNWVAELKKLFPNLIFEVAIVSPKYGSWNHLPNVDVAVCTFWMTAFSLAQFNNCKKKFYLLQDDERLFYPVGSESSLVEETYRLGFLGLANSERIKEVYDAISGGNALKYTPGINTTLLNVKEYQPKGKVVRIISYARPSVSRNMFEILNTVLSSIADELGDHVDITFVGEDFSHFRYGTSSKIKILGNVANPSAIFKLYEDCDIGISLISTPTISYQQLDILSAGRCLVAVKNGEFEKYFNNDVVHYVSPLPQVMKEQLLELISNKSLIKKLATNGRSVVSAFNWEISLKKIISHMEES